MISTLCKRYKDASSLIGREKLENVRVSGLIGRRIFFFCLASGLTGREKKKSGHVSGQRPLRIFLKNNTGAELDKRGTEPTFVIQKLGTTNLQNIANFNTLENSVVPQNVCYSEVYLY